MRFENIVINSDAVDTRSQSSVEERNPFGKSESVHDGQMDSKGIPNFVFATDAPKNLKTETLDSKKLKLWIPGTDQHRQ